MKTRIKKPLTALMMAWGTYLAIPCPYKVWDEALYIDDAPISAAINEAVELTRKYENEDVVSFVNGILGGFAREVQQLC